MGQLLSGRPEDPNQPIPEDPNQLIPKEKFFSAAANVHPASDGKSYDVCPHDSPSSPTLTIKTIHLSCQSDTYHEGEHMYGGIVIYGRNDKGDWWIKNDTVNTHCKSGYVVITQTDTQDFKKLQREWPNEPGQVHGVIYRKAFGESCNDENVVAEGFGIINGEFKIVSGAFNPSNNGDVYHDDSSLMHENSARYIEALVKIWKRAGPNFPDKQNYSVEEL